MKKLNLIICLLFTFVIVFAGNPPEKVIERINPDYSNTSYQFMNNTRIFIYPEWGFYIEQSTGYAMLRNSNLSSDIWNMKGGLGFTFNAGYFRSLSPTFRVKAGLGFTYYTSTLEGNGELTAKDLSDIDNDNYDETLTLLNAENKANPMYISIPLVLEFGNVNINKSAFYINAGIRYSFLLLDNYESGGSYSTKGTYEQWGVTLEDIDELGFYSERGLESESEFKKSNLSVLGAFGISLPVSSVVILKLGITGSFGLLDIGNNPPMKDDTSPITLETYNFRAKYIDNNFAASNGTKTGYIGFEIGLYINKRLK